MPDRSRVLESRVLKSKIESLSLDFDTWRMTFLKNRKNDLTTKNPIWLTTKNRGTIWQKSNDEEQRNDLTDDEEQRNDLMEEQRKNQEELDFDWRRRTKERSDGTTEEEPRTLELRLDDWMLVFRSARRRTLGISEECKEEEVKMVKFES